MNASDLHASAQTLLRQSVGDAQARFRDGQFEAIEHILSRRGPLLVVQRTGWGKSNVYFIATRLLRQRGSGPALLISPLLALMRNQIAAAARMGVRAARITSEQRSQEEWAQVREDLLAGRIDILLISPERLANEEFVQHTLLPIAARIGFLVIDEAHCISDWGHDFRPDYRRIARILQSLPRNLPLLATTATANDRVVADLKKQLGAALTVHRGELARPSLALQNIRLPNPLARLAWLADTVPALPGSGIIYALTIRDARIVAKWLKQNGIKAQPYWGGMDGELDKPGLREKLEHQLLANELKALVATTALGMGFDKPDLAFVIHFQLPGSVIHYYQQVGRAGRALSHAHGVLLAGDEDHEITDYFIESAFPPRAHVERILAALRDSADGLSVPDLQARLNLTFGQLDKALKLLALESPATVVKDHWTWKATATPLSPVFWERVERLTRQRREEQSLMREYVDTRQCLMQFLSRALDDPHARPCGRCACCVGRSLLPVSFHPSTAERAARFLRRLDYPIPPRKSWPKGAFTRHEFHGKITDALASQEGRVLAIWGDAGWGDLIRSGKYQTARFDDRLVEAAADMIQRWKPEPRPTWLTCVPSLNHTELVPDFAARLAARLGLKFHPCLAKTRPTPAQKEMQNSFQQARNLDGAFAVEPWARLHEPVFLVDDMVDSGWTFAVSGALLRLAGSGPVFPVALAQTSKTEDT